MPIYALVQITDNLIVNSIVWDGDPGFTVPDGLRMQLDDFHEYQIGGTLTAGGVYTPPTPPEE